VIRGKQSKCERRLNQALEIYGPCSGVDTGLCLASRHGSGGIALRPCPENQSVSPIRRAPLRPARGLRVVEVRRPLQRSLKASGTACKPEQKTWQHGHLVTVT